MKTPVLTIKTNKDLQKLMALLKAFKLGKSKGDEVIHAYKYTRSDGRSPYNHGTPIHYRVGRVAEVGYVNTSNDDCGAGVNIASLAWVNRNKRQRPNPRVFVMEFRVKDIASIPLKGTGWPSYHRTNTPHGKFRVRRAKTVKRVE